MQTAPSDDATARPRHASADVRGRRLAATRRTLERVLHALGISLRTAEIVLWSAFFVLALAFLGLRYWLLPNVERYREPLLAAVSKAVGLPVTVGRIEADWRGLRPRLNLTDVRIQDRAGRDALVLPVIENVLSWRSLFTGGLRLHSLTIDGPKLAVRRDPQGRLSIAGIVLQPSAQQGEGRLAAWLLGQREIAIRSAEIEWLDELRGAPPLALGALELRLRNSGQSHSIGVTARPPAALGTSFEARAEWIGDALAIPAGWNGRLFAELGNTDLAGWRPWVDYPFDLSAGRGGVRLWATLGGGQIGRATADVKLERVVARLAPDLPLLELSSVEGRLSGRATQRTFELGGDGLSLQFVDGVRMRRSSFRVHWTPASASDNERGAVAASLIELSPLARLTHFLPVPAGLRELMSDLSPRGELFDLKLEWVGKLPDALHYDARARFSGLSMNAWRRIPGFQGLAGRIEATPSRGVVTLDAGSSEIDLPRVFPQPRIALNALKARIEWLRGAGSQLTVKLSTLQFANQHLAGSASGTYQYGGDGPGEIDLTAAIDRADGRHTAQYLPSSAIMGTATRRWLEGAILAGAAREVRLRLRGDLREFPFVDPAKGEFRVDARVEGGVLDYADGWPRIEQIDGTLLFEREKIQIVARSARILGARLEQVQVAIPNLLAPKTDVRIAGVARGPTATFLDYIARSPVRRMVQGFTHGMRAEGAGALRLKLLLPLADLSGTQVDGTYEFKGNRINLHAQLPPIENAVGRLHFDAAGLRVEAVRGQFLGGPTAIRGGTLAGGGVEIHAEGTATVDGIRAVFDHPMRSRLRGAAPYRATLRAGSGAPRVRFDTTLRGVESRLPAPLAKAADEELPLRIEVLPAANGERDRISLAAGQLIRAEFFRQREAGAMQLVRTGIAVGLRSELRLPEREGITIVGALDQLDLDRWMALIQGPRAGAAGAAVADAGGARGVIDLRTGVLDVNGKRLNGAVLKASIDARGWSASVNARELEGDFTYRVRERGELIARLARFEIPDDTPNPGAAAQGQDARALPAIDLIAERFSFRGKSLGRVEIAAVPVDADWRIDKLVNVNPDAALRGKGLWRTHVSSAPGGPPTSQTSIDFALEISNVGRFLERIGYPGLMRDGAASLQGRAGWQAGPLAIDYPSLAGNLKLDAKDGQFLEIEPGIGKLVSLMSMQMLPRRIALDFRDVFSKGFQFDRIRSDIRIERGILGTESLEMRGPAAVVRISGTTNLATERQDLKVRVVPSLGDSASTVVGLLNPVAGVATMIAQRLLKNPLGEIFAYDYAITGGWSDPEVKKLGAQRVTSTGSAEDSASQPIVQPAPKVEELPKTQTRPGAGAN